MVKIKRSERLVDMTRYLMEHPHTLISLTYFSKKYGSAKSSISEDLSIVKRTFEASDMGIVETLPGAAGGVRYIPSISDEDARIFIEEICEMMASKDRVLPGGYVYLSDLLGNRLNSKKSVGLLLLNTRTKK